MTFVIKLFCLFMVFCFNSEFAYAGFFVEKSRGWHWYEVNEVEEEVLGDIPQKNPTEQVEAIRKDIEGKLHKALIRPTEKNVIAYISAQEAIGDKSEKFANVWQRVVYKNPELDRTNRYPVSNGALHIFRNQELNQKREKIRQLSKEYGLMFFFRGDCPYCQGFASVVKDFSIRYDWSLMAIQIGDVGLDGFLDAKRDNGIAASLGISKVPALIAVHPRTKKMIPLAYGYISEAEIEERVNVLLSNEAIR